MARDDFSARTKDDIAKRVGYQCSNPGCQQITTGPRAGESGSVNVGVAAHITAASPGGPRFDPEFTPDQRSSAANGIWLCQNHAKLIDSDTQTYSASSLREWKRRSESDATRKLESPDLPQRDGYDASRPTFEIIGTALNRRETEFTPNWKIRQVPGTDYVRNLEWRFRGPRFEMEWRPMTGANLTRSTISHSFDLSQGPSITDDKVGTDEIGLEIRFPWRSSMSHELHRWPLTRRTLPTKILWDISTELAPPLEWDQATAVAAMSVPLPQVLEVTLPEPIVHRVSNDWVFTISRERWRETPEGLVLATHLDALNLTSTDAGLPVLEITSGALRRSEGLELECLHTREELPGLAGSVPAGESVSGWIVTPLSPRFAGGRPGYVIQSSDVPGNWRGIARPPVDEPRDQQRQEAPAIADALAHWYWWGGQILDGIRRTEERYQRDPKRWDDSLGGTPELARGKLFKSHEEKHRGWAQIVTNYLRDSVGRSYSDRFDGNPDSTQLQRWMETQLGVLDSYLTEFRQLASKT